MEFRRTSHPKAISYELKASRGFSLIEFMVVVGLIALIGSFSLTSLSTFRRQSDLDSDAGGVLAALRLARSRTISSENAENYGVYFASATYTVFPGRSFDPAAAYYGVNFLSQCGYRYLHQLGV